MNDRLKPARLNVYFRWSFAYYLLEMPDDVLFSPALDSPQRGIEGFRIIQRESIVCSLERRRRGRPLFL